jgi:hypothetical protein
MLVLDLPPQLPERVVCSISAAVKYEVPVNIMLAIAEKEGGRPGQWKRNDNGTDDVGPMQFNTAYLRELARYRITADVVARAGCYSFDLAAWRLRVHIKRDKGDVWTRAANYHSRTPRYNATYRSDLIRRAAKWANWLESRFTTYNFHATNGVAKVNSMPEGPIQMRPVNRSAAYSVEAPYVWRKLVLINERP